jgi:hypothetical protein
VVDAIDYSVREMVDLKAHVMSTVREAEETALA